MKNQTYNLLEAAKRTIALIAVVGVVFGAGSGVVSAAAAGGQVQYRSIRLSDNGASGGAITTGVGSGTNVSYRVSFRAASNYTIKGVIVDFCRGTDPNPPSTPRIGTPFIGDANCPALPGFTVGATPTVDTSAFDGATGLGAGWTATSLNSGQTFEMTNATGAALTNDGSTNYTFAINGVTNTSDVGTFYARLITYSSDTGDITSYTHASAGNYQDYGGFALSTAQIVQVTAKVQETLTFCVSGTTDTLTPYPNTQLIAPNSCASTAPPSIILGHGDNNTLSPDQIDRNTVWTIISTNALRGAVIRMHNSNACGGLSTDSGTTCSIPAIGSGVGTPTIMRNGGTSGLAAFGMFCYNSDAGPLGSNIVVGAMGCDANYNDPAHTTFSSEGTASPSANDMSFGMDTTTVDNNVTSTYGDPVASTTAPVSNARNRYDFAATASNTTPAGIYKANLAMIATSTF